jgi:uncharacterized membrane protein YbhN (UPF0104 family)
MTPILRRALHWVGSALAIIGIAFVVLRLRNYGADLDLSGFDSSKWSMVAGLSVIYGLSNLMLAFAWWNLLRQFGANASPKWATKIFGISQLAKYVPGNIFHLAGRQTMGMAVGISGWTLAKSSIWELGLISVAGAMFGVLTLPLLIPNLSIIISAGLFAAAVVAAVIVVRRFGGVQIVRAFSWHLAFLALSGLVFTALIGLLVESTTISGVKWLAVCGAYVVAWLIGLITPGAPAGVGVRELVLLFLLKDTITEAELVLVVLLGRTVTVTGDLLAFVFATLMSSDSHEQGKISA